MQDLMAALETVKQKKSKVEDLQSQLRAASDEHQVAVAEASKLHEAFSASVAEILPADRKR